MKTINLNCLNEDLFKYSLLISLYYYHLKEHKKRTNKLNKWIINDHNFSSMELKDFENNRWNISLSVSDGVGRNIYKSNNESINKGYIVETNNNNNRDHALKPIKEKYKQLEELLNQFTHKEITNFILKKMTS